MNDLKRVCCYASAPEKLFLFFPSSISSMPCQSLNVVSIPRFRTSNSCPQSYNSCFQFRSAPSPLFRSSLLCILSISMSKFHIVDAFIQFPRSFVRSSSHSASDFFHVYFRCRQCTSYSVITFNPFSPRLSIFPPSHPCSFRRQSWSSLMVH